MKLKLLILPLIVFVLINSVFANHVSKQRAEKVAKNWYQYFSTAAQTTLNVENYTAITRNSDTLIHSFVFQEGGWVLIAADDASKPVLAYSFSSKLNLETKNPAFQDSQNKGKSSK